MFRLLSIAVLAASLAWIAGCNGSATEVLEVKDPTILPVRVAKVARRTEFSYPLDFYGRINAAKESALSFELAGRVVEVLADEGDDIQQGQHLASLNTEILTAQRQLLVAKKNVEKTLLRRLVNGARPEAITAAQAAVERLKVEVKRALLKERREQKLLQTKSISESRYDQLKFDYESLAFSLKEAQARLAELESGSREEDIEAQQQRVVIQDAELTVLDMRIQQASLFAPFHGQVLQRVVDDGMVVEAGQPVLVVSESNHREARFSLPITQLDELANVESVSADDQEIAVTGFRVVSNVDASTRTVDVVFVLESTPDVIVGESCTVNLRKVVKQDCVELPADALVPSVRGLWSCFRVEKIPDAEGFLIVKEEVTVEHTDGDRVFVGTTLPDDALIVTQGAHKLVAGMQVWPMDGSR